MEMFSWKHLVLLFFSELIQIKEENYTLYYILCKAGYERKVHAKSCENHPVGRVLLIIQPLQGTD